jgi:DNA-binding transcriptional MerR regulator
MNEMYTMGQVAKEAGVTKNTLAKWESAGKVPSPKRERGGNRARAYTDAERAQVLEYARGRKELEDPPARQPRGESRATQKKKTA